jgi:hypothetical protein
MQMSQTGSHSQKQRNAGAWAQNPIDLRLTRPCLTDESAKLRGSTLSEPYSRGYQDGRYPYH